MRSAEEMCRVAVVGVGLVRDERHVHRVRVGAVREGHVLRESDREPPAAVATARTACLVGRGLH